MRSTEEGTFAHCTDVAAFGDTVEINLEADVQKDWATAVRSMRSLPIAGDGSCYARERQGILALTGNTVGLKYGRRKRYPNVPRVKLRIHSESNPITGSQTLSAITLLTQNRADAAVSWIEMTYDLTGTTVNDVYRQVFSRACFGARFFGNAGLETFYRGTRKSSWSLRVYAKTPAVTRFEYVFRRAFLARKRITEIWDVTNLRMLNLRRLATCRLVNSEEFGNLLTQLRESSAVFIRRLAESHPQLAERALRREHRLNTENAFPISGLQLKLERMQRNFIW